MFKKITRQINLFRNLRNPQVYLGYKFGLLKQDPLFLKLRNRVVAEVPTRLISTFKESVFEQDYIRGFPHNVVRNFDKLNVVDVGANVGYFSLWWLSCFPRGQVIAIEPMPNNFALLSRNKALNPDKNFHVVNSALRNQAGEITLNFNRNDSFTTAASIIKGAGGEDDISVPATSLKQLMADFGLSQIDFLKLDCEGSEYDILYNCENTLLDSIKYISMETHHGTDATESKEAMCNFLRVKKFHVSTKPGSKMVYAYR